MCFYDGDSDVSTVWREQIILKSKKTHKCTECHEEKAIKPGDSYFTAAHLFEGRWDTYKCCARCYFARSLIYYAERKEGCHEHESWPSYYTLSDDWSEGGYDVRLGLVPPRDNWERKKTGLPEIPRGSGERVRLVDLERW